MKYSIQITDGERIGEFVERAWQAATSGYPGPVHLSLPVDIMFSSFEEDAGRDERPWVRHQTRPQRAWPEPKRLTDILNIVENSERPVIIGGHGIWWSHSEKSLAEVGEKLKIPILMYLTIQNCWVRIVLPIWGLQIFINIILLRWLFMRQTQ